MNSKGKVTKGPKLHKFAAEMTLHPVKEFERDGTRKVVVKDGKGRTAVFPKAWLDKQYHNMDFNEQPEIEPPLRSYVLAGSRVFYRSINGNYYAPGSATPVSFSLIKTFGTPQVMVFS